MAQTAKKKTVKELNIDVINLAMEFKRFNDILEGITTLSVVKNLDEKILALGQNFENQKKMKDLEDEVNKNTLMLNDLSRGKADDSS